MITYDSKMILKRGDIVSIQVSTRIDESTKRQFDAVCESIGISPSNALSMFIKSVINYNGIPFQAIKPPGKKTPKFGSWKGDFWMSEDFNEPLDDFKEYMQ